MLERKQEQELIERAQKGDGQAFGELYDNHIEPIYRFVFLKVNTKQEAEDIVQDVFLSSWRSIGSYTSHGFPFSSWLYRIARNKVIDHYRTKKSVSDIESVPEHVLKEDSSFEDAANTKLDIDRIRVHLYQLTPDQKDVIIMRFVEELSHREIALTLNKSEGAVRLIQYRAIHNLRDLAQEDRNIREV